MDNRLKSASMSATINSNLLSNCESIDRFDLDL